MARNWKQIICLPLVGSMHLSCQTRVHPKFLSWTQNLSLFSGSHARRGSQAMAIALAKSHNEAGQTENDDKTE